MSNRSSGRRRRGGGRPTSNRGPTDGNRHQAHRNSGNAHQLLDKYKNLARDAHQQGDRVLNEYYLQFSDHYFRVLAEVNDRKDDQKRPREDSPPKQQDRKEGSSRKPEQDRNDGSSRTDDKDDMSAGEPASKSRSSKSDDKKDGAKRSSSSSATKKSDSSAEDGEDLKISADVLPGAVPVESAAKEMNGKSPAKKPAASRSRGKPSDGDSPTAET
ncbi:MAG: DUF4167 domain-containing protein [Parasphingopyxis sp.]